MIKQAIIPLAGLGTRLLPLTSVFAKELLPINGKPGLEYIINECIDAGIKEIIFIISKRKMMIKKYFYNDKFYKELIKKSIKFNKKTIVSIFVNPKQFNETKDFKSYPSNIKNDLSILKKIKNLDFIYIPQFKDIYENKKKITYRN